MAWTLRGIIYDGGGRRSQHIQNVLYNVNQAKWTWTFISNSKGGTEHNNAVGSLQANQLLFFLSTTNTLDF